MSDPTQSTQPTISDVAKEAAERYYLEARFSLEHGEAAKPFPRLDRIIQDAIDKSKN